MIVFALLLFEKSKIRDIRQGFINGFDFRVLGELNLEYFIESAHFQQLV